MTQTTQSSGSAAANFGMAAWITYGIAAADGHWVWAAIGGLAIALAIVGHEYSRNAVKIMDCTTAGYFLFALLVTIAAGPWLFKSYNIFLTWAVFAAVTWVTMIIGFPFTTEYAREQAPPEVWEHPVFLRLNVILTVIFGVMFTVNAILGLLALRTGHLVMVGLLLPMLLLIAALVFSSKYPKWYTERFAPEWAAAQAAQAAANQQ